MARPTRPRSFGLTLVLSTVIDTKGVESRLPFLMMRTRAVLLVGVPRSVTKMRPSGAKAIAVGLLSPPTSLLFTKPLGSAQTAGEIDTRTAERAVHTKRRMGTSRAEER